MRSSRSVRHRQSDCRRITAAWGAVVLAAVTWVAYCFPTSSLAAESDCAYYRQVYQRYLQNCQSYDGCSNKLVQEQHVIRVCGSLNAPATPNGTIEALEGQRARLQQLMESTRIATANAEARQAELFELQASNARRDPALASSCPFQAYCTETYRCCIDPHYCSAAPPCPGVTPQQWIDGTPPPAASLPGLARPPPQDEEGRDACPALLAWAQTDLAQMQARYETAIADIAAAKNDLHALKQQLENDRLWLDVEEVGAIVLYAVDVPGSLLKDSLISAVRGLEFTYRVGAAVFLYVGSEIVSIVGAAQDGTLDLKVVTVPESRQLAVKALQEALTRVSVILDTVARFDALGKGARETRAEFRRSAAAIDRSIRNVEANLLPVQAMRDQIRAFRAEISARCSQQSVPISAPH